MKYPNSLQELIEYFKLLPGIGEKNAERLAFAVLKFSDEQVEGFSESLKNVKTKIKKCEFNGKYHVLEGLISPLEGVNPEDIKINQLINRIKDEKIKEVILALTPNIEGETTSGYILKMLEGYDVSVTKIAAGIPVGADMEYLDPLTIQMAMQGRNKLS